MKNTDIYKLLDTNRVWYYKLIHEALYNMSDVEELGLVYPNSEAKNLFLKDTKNNYYLLTVSGTKRVDLNNFRKKEHISRLSFASCEELQSILSLTQGSVTPFGLLKASSSVNFYLDKSLLNGIIAIHP